MEAVIGRTVGFADIRSRRSIGRSGLKDEAARAALALVAAVDFHLIALRILRFG